MMFWAKIDPSDVPSNPSQRKYVFSSGGNDRRSRGFSLFHQDGHYVLQAVNREKQWRQSIPNTEIPSNSWISFAFTWGKGTWYSTVDFHFEVFTLFELRFRWMGLF